MGWFSKKKKQSPDPETNKDVFVQCRRCQAHVFREEWEKQIKVCPRCNYHDRLTARERLELLIDDGSFHELGQDITPGDPLSFADAGGSYADKAEDARRKTEMNEAVLAGHGRLSKIQTAIAIMDFRFLGGSLGGGTGEKILMATEYAVSHKCPCIIVTASGGARMHEGLVSLMQMAKTCAGVARLRQRSVPLITVLTDPTTGGVSASYAMVGDIHLAEPGALIGFAGRRVIEETIKQKLPDDFQTAEYLRDHGFIDSIVQRTDMKAMIHRLLVYCGCS